MGVISQMPSLVHQFLNLVDSQIKILKFVPKAFTIVSLKILVKVVLGNSLFGNCLLSKLSAKYDNAQHLLKNCHIGISQLNLAH